VARRFLDTYGQLFGLTDQAQELTVMRTRAVDRGRSFVRFQQVYQGIPVFGGELIVQLNADKNVVSANGEILPDLALGITPKLDASAAQEVARRFVARGYGLSTDNLTVNEAELWIYNPILLGGPGPRFSALVWRTEVPSLELAPINELVLVDAQLGAIALHFNQVNTGKNRVIYDNQNDPNAGLPGYGPVRAEGQPATGITDVDQAYDYTGDTYDFYLDMHGRDSLDNAGMTLISTVRYCEPGEECPYANAYWDGQQMVYGEGQASDDTVGHELTHGVTEFESHLYYYMQSGAINESFSDIWGEIVDLSNGAGNDTAGVRWLMFEDCPDGAGRNMKDPPNPPNPCGTWPCNIPQPDRVGNSTYYWCAETDQGGVHINSGIGNKAAYLMVDGDTFNGYTVTGIGIEKTAKIFYEVQANLLTSAAEYNDLYDALQQACTNLIGASGITAADCQEVQDAVDATEMNQQPTSCPATEAPVCPAGQSPTNLFFDDLEAGINIDWSRGANVGNPDWYVGNSYATSGVYHLVGYDVPTISDHYEYMNTDVALPAGSTPYLHFNHAYGFDNFQAETYDGGVIEYSTTGGASWTDAGSLFTHNGYNGTIDTRFGNPLAGQQAFVGDSYGYYSSRLNLSSLAGQNARFRFRIGTDGEVSDRGWFIDDVRIYTCAAQPTPQLLQNPGFETGSWAPWQTSGSPSLTSDISHSGSWSADMGGYDNAEDYIWQEVDIPADATDVTIDFWYQLSTDETYTEADYFCYVIYDQTGTTDYVSGCLDFGLMGDVDWTEETYSLTAEELAEVADQTVLFSLGLIKE